MLLTIEPSLKENQMPTLQEFSLPAFVQDFPAGSVLDRELRTKWNINVSAWIQQAITGSAGYFYDPTRTDIPAGTGTALVTWNAFPGRLQQFYSATPPNNPVTPKPLTVEEIYALADTGYLDGGRVASFPDIPASLCPQADWDGTLKTFGPYGPRGWLDEYCEWSAARDAAGNLVRVDFACENPEYWNTLWQVSPDAVRQIYEDVLNHDVPADRRISVELDDLVLKFEGRTVEDPYTGQPVYDPLNKWNSGPIALRTGDPATFAGGVMHLTSTPNTLQTELGLAGAATVQYAPPDGQKDEQSLICCGNYGQEYRNSDPHIGKSVNDVVGAGTGNYVCLADPVGLYLQTPTLTSFSFGRGVDTGKLPADAQASDVWQVLRGAASVNDPVSGEPFGGSMILHAICQIPSSWLVAQPALTLADIEISNVPIAWAGQIAEQFNVGLYARPLPAETPPPGAGCSTAPPSPGGPLQIMYADVWNAFYSAQELAPTGQRMSLASNTTYIPPYVPTNGDRHSMVVTCNMPTGAVTVNVMESDGRTPDDGITVEVVGSEQVTYAVPGNSYPGTYSAISVSIGVPLGATAGLRGIQIVDPTHGPQTFPAMIYLAQALVEEEARS